MMHLHCDLPVSPPSIHHIHHDIHDTYICQKLDSQDVNLSNLQHFCVWKHVFWVDETLENLIQISSKHALRCATTSQLFFLRHFGLRRPRGATRPISCFCFCSLCRKGHHCGNKLFPVSVSESVIHTEKPIAEVGGCFFGFWFIMYVSFIGLRLTKTSLTLINRTRLRTKGQSAGYPQAQIGITSNFFQRRAP